MSEPTKVCKDCGIEKPLSEFYRHPQTADGHLGNCKECKRAYQRAHSRTPRARALARRRYHNNPDRQHSITRRARRWDRENPNGYRAHNMLNNAVRDGRIDKPNGCDSCGATGTVLHGHHEDYSRPLDVEWLCPACHGERHSQHAEDAA